MSTQNMLEFTLAEILYVVNPLREDMETRMRIIDELREAVSSIESLKGATVEPFGSFLSQLFSRWGDLDISIELSNGSHILVPGRKRKQLLLEDVLKALRRTGSFKRLQFVPHARVPILKLESKVRNISCDISINNLLGHMKSNFFLWISLIDRRFRDMVLLVKEWAKANGINNPRGGTFNSYSLSLLVIFHFQTCAPAILPPLEDLYPGNMADELTGVRADAERRIEKIATGNIAKFRKERRANHSSLSELFISFLGKFLDISIRTMEQGICTYSGRWLNINTNTRWLPRTKAIFIEDPFEQPENTARTVDASKLTRIADAFRNTYYLLIDPYRTRNTLIPLLVRYEISQWFPGAAFVIPRGTMVNSYQNAHLGIHSSSQHEFQTKSQVSQLKNLKGQNGKQLSAGRQMRAASRQLPREKRGSQGQNVNRQKTGQNVDGQNTGEVVDRQNTVEVVERQKMGQDVERQKTSQSVERQKRGQNGDRQKVVKNAGLQKTGQNAGQQKTGQNADQQRTGQNVGPQRKGQVDRQRAGQNVDRQRTGQNVDRQTMVQNVGRQATGENVNWQKTGQNVDRERTGHYVGPQKMGQNVGRRKAGQNVFRRKAVQNVDRQKTGQNLDQQKTGQNVDRQKTGEQSRVQVLPVSPKIVGPPWPHTLQPKPNNNLPLHCS